MQTLATDPVLDTITITSVATEPVIIHADAGAELRWDNRDVDHHLIVLQGTCRVLGRRVDVGGSAYVPAGIAHTVTAGAWGCTILSVDSAHQAV